MKGDDYVNSIQHPDADTAKCSVEPRAAGRQKRPLKPKDAWAIRVSLELNGSKRDLALFHLAIDSSYARATSSG